MGDLAFGLSLTVLVLVLHVPQILRVRRTDSTAGLSDSSLLNGIVAYTVWAWYLLLEDEVALALTSLAGGAVWLTLLLSVRARRGPFSRRSWVIAWAWAAALIITGVQSVEALGFVLGFTVVVTYTPAVLAAWRSPAIGAISISTWALCSLDGLIWLAWGVLNDVLGAVLYGSIIGIAALLVFTAIAVRREARSRLDHPILAEPTAT